MIHAEFSRLTSRSAKPRTSARAERTGAAGRLAFVATVTIALVILCLTACVDSTAPSCTTTTRTDSLAWIAGVDTVWSPLTISVTVCR